MYVYIFHPHIYAVQVQPDPSPPPSAAAGRGRPLGGCQLVELAAAHVPAMSARVSSSSRVRAGTPQHGSSAVCQGCGTSQPNVVSDLLRCHTNE
jgi:hypothetical protein